MAVLRLAPLLLLALGGCTIETFACADVGQCDLRDGPALCLDDGVCAYADDACESGFRRSANARTDANVCVPADGSTGSVDPTDPTSTSSTSSTSSGSGSETCAPLEWFPDVDGDGFGDAAAEPTLACDAPNASVDNADDCDDSDPRLRPDHLQCDDNPGMLAWYRLDDEAGTGFALDATSDAVGTPSGRPELGVEGAFGTAIAFAGHPDLVDIAETVTAIAPGGAPLESGTVELWAWPTPLDESCAADCAQFLFQISDEEGDGFGNNTPDLHLHINNAGADTPYRWHALIDGVFAGGESCRLEGPTIEPETWTHLALRWDARECSLWVNGTMTEVDPGVVPSPTWTVGRIGHPPQRPDRAFVGRIDEVMIFDHARSTMELRRDCGRDPCPPG